MAVSNEFYAGLSDLNNIYGERNIVRWSDVDNDEVINELRVDWALEQANIYIDGRLTETMYDSAIPFGSVDCENVPPIIRLMAATLAGLFLYDTRRIIDAQDPTDQVSQQRMNFDRWMKQILKGQLKLRDVNNDPIEKDSANSPFNEND